MTSAILNFEESTHTYSVGVHVIPSVTEILKDAGMVSYEFTSEFARERGSAAHKAIHFAMENDLEEESVHAIILGYVNAARRCVADLGLKIVAVERRMVSAAKDTAGKPLYAGTLDLLAEHEGKLALFDWKTGDPPPATALQLAAYAELWFDAEATNVSRRYAVRLYQDGRYAVIPYTDRHDIVRFRAAVTVAAWRRENALL